jgi:hypothetical protein
MYGKFTIKRQGLSRHKRVFSAGRRVVIFACKVNGSVKKAMGGWKQSTSPWYPTMRIFNQEKLLEWRPVVREVREALAGLV